MSLGLLTRYGLTRGPAGPDVTGTDFSEYTAGSTALQDADDWTKRWNTTAVYGVIEDAGFEGGKAADTDTTVSALQAISYDPTDDSDDIETLTKILTTHNTNQQMRVFARGGGAAASETGYMLTLVGTNFRLWSPSSFVVGASVTFSAATWYWVRFRLIGTSIKARVWADGDTEPSTWQIDTTDATHSSGWAGFGTLGNQAGSVRCDWFSYALDEGTAPAP